MNNFLKKFIVLISFGFILFGFNFVSAEDIIPDTIAPEITLIGESDISITIGNIYTDTGVTANDNVDGDITSFVITNGTVDTGTVGTYTITYNVSDKAGNVAKEVVRNVLVEKEIEKPEPEEPVSKTENVFIRNGDNVIFDSVVDSLEVGTIKIKDNSGTEHEIDNQSVLALLYSISQRENAPFDISNLEYYSSFSAFYLKCITPKGGEELCDNWQYVVNGTTPWTGMDQTILKGGESVGFYFGTPHKLNLDKSNIYIGETITISALNYDYLNNSWKILTGVNIDVTIPNESNPWSPTVVIEASVDENGQATITLVDEGTYTFGIKEDYSFPSYLVTVTKPSSGGGGGSDVEENFSIENALSFLSLQQESDGSFGDSLYTDWVAIATSKVGGDANMLNSKLRNYLKNESFEASNITDYERHAMALMALGINPYDGTDINYIGEIVDSFDGKQIGYDSLYNDDIFALIVLSSAGYSKKDEMIEKIVSYVISKQSSSGAWGSIDMTAAAIEALSNFESLDGVEDAISKGESYLVGKQKSDGSFENVFSTSWAIQALSLNNAFNDEVDNAIKYLISNQQSDGGVTDDSNIKSRIWATSYALPAVSKLSWNNILESFSKEENEESNSSDDGEEKVSEEENKETVVLIDEAKLMDVSKKETKPVEPKVEIKAMQNVALGDTKGQQSDRENFDGNLLGASALDSGQINENSHFLSFISMVFDIIKTLFNRLLVVLHI